MQQTQNLFPEDNVSKPKVVTNQLQNPFSNFFALSDKDNETATVIVFNRMNNNSVKHFDLVTENSAFKTNNSKETNKTKEPNSANLPFNQKPLFKIAPNFSSNANLSLVATNNSEELIDLLLFYFDQIVCLNEISEKIKELDVAVNSGDLALINSIANECSEISLYCEVDGALASLKQLAQLKTKLQITDAQFLIRRVRKEFARFRFALQENLKTLDKQIQLKKLALVS